MEKILTTIPLLTQQLEQLFSQYTTYSQETENQLQFVISSEIKEADIETIENEIKRGENVLSSLSERKETNTNLLTKSYEIMGYLVLINKLFEEFLKQRELQSKEYEEKAKLLINQLMILGNLKMNHKSFVVHF